MHPNPIFKKSSELLNIDFARQRSFGTLAINAKAGPLLSHVPFLLSKDGKNLEAHLVRSNPILKLIEGESDVVISVLGPDSYISPDWYRIDDQVPTWNYIAVHLRGKMIAGPATELRGVLERLSQHLEQCLLPKPVWKIDKVEEQALAKMEHMIVPITMEVSSIEGTWKLSQNKSDDARISAAEEVAKIGIGSQIAELSELMKNPPC